MLPAKVIGGIPLNGVVVPGGSPLLSVWLIAGSLYATDGVILQNVPRSGWVLSSLDVLQELGVNVTWLDEHKLLLDASGLSQNRVPHELGSSSIISQFLVGPLVYHFGSALIPRVAVSSFDSVLDLWRSLGFQVSYDNDWINVSRGSSSSATIPLNRSISLTAHALLAGFGLGDLPRLVSPAEQHYTQALADFLTRLGGTVKLSTEALSILGTPPFRGIEFAVTPDSDLAVPLAVLALGTNGSITIRHVDKTLLLSFLALLNNMHANFEFQGDDLVVWRDNDVLNPVNITMRGFPGMPLEWLPLLLVLLGFSAGESRITLPGGLIFKDVIRDLNSLGAKISFGSSADLAQLVIQGNVSLNGSSLYVSPGPSGIALFVASLIASGTSELRDFQNLDCCFDSLMSLVTSLGANIQLPEFDSEPGSL